MIFSQLALMWDIFILFNHLSFHFEHMQNFFYFKYIMSSFSPTPEGLCDTFLDRVRTQSRGAMMISGVRGGGVGVGRPPTTPSPVKQSLLPLNQQQQQKGAPYPLPAVETPWTRRCFEPGYRAMTPSVANAPSSPQQLRPLSKSTTVSGATAAASASWFGGTSTSFDVLAPDTSPRHDYSGIDAGGSPSAASLPPSVLSFYGKLPPPAMDTSAEAVSSRSQSVPVTAHAHAAAMRQRMSISTPRPVSIRRSKKDVSDDDDDECGGVNDDGSNTPTAGGSTQRPIRIHRHGHDAYSKFEDAVVSVINAIRMHPMKARDMISTSSIYDYTTLAGDVVRLRASKVASELRFLDDVVAEKQKDIDAIPQWYDKELRRHLQRRAAELAAERPTSSQAPSGKKGAKSAAGSHISQVATPTADPAFLADLNEQRAASKRRLENVRDGAKQCKASLQSLVSSSHALTETVVKRRAVHSVQRSRGLSLVARDICHHRAMADDRKATDPVAGAYGVSTGRVRRIVIRGTMNESEFITELLRSQELRLELFSQHYYYVGVGWQPTEDQGGTLVLVFAERFQESCGIARRDFMSLGSARRDLKSRGGPQDAALQITYTTPALQKKVRLVWPRFHPVVCEGTTEIVLDCVDPSYEVHATLGGTHVASNLGDVYWHREENRVRVFARCSSVGVHKLHLFCSEGRGAAATPGLVKMTEITLRCVEVQPQSFQAFQFPTLHVAFHDRHCQLVTPRENPLKHNNVYQFAIVVPHHNHVAATADGVVKEQKRLTEHISELSKDIDNAKEHLESEKLRLSQEIEGLQQNLVKLKGEMPPPPTAGGKQKKITAKEQDRLADLQDRISNLEQTIARKQHDMSGLERSLHDKESEMRSLLHRRGRLDVEFEGLCHAVARQRPLTVELMSTQQGKSRRVSMAVGDAEYTLYSVLFRVRYGSVVTMCVDGFSVVSWDVVL